MQYFKNFCVTEPLKNKLALLVSLETPRVSLETRLVSHETRLVSLEMRLVSLETRRVSLEIGSFLARLVSFSSRHSLLLAGYVGLDLFLRRKISKPKEASLSKQTMDPG